MRKLDLRKLLFLLLLITPLSGLLAQSPAPLIWGSSPFQDSLWSVDTTTWSVVNRMGPTMAGFTIAGINGIAWDPVGHETYIIAKNSSNVRVLGKIDVNTGIVTMVDTLGLRFSTINFRSDGQLFGVTGNGQNPNPETMFLIDKTTAASTLAIALGNGADGEIISYNYDDNNFYHWSGNSTMVMEKFPATAPYTPVTNIVTSGISSGETFGAIYLGNNDFIISNISSQFKHVSASGAYGPALMNLPDDFRGLVMPPRFAFSASTICVGDSATWSVMPGQNRDTLIYSWGDGTTTTVFPPVAATHTYSVAGNYTAYAILKNSIVGMDSVFSSAITVNALPNVALNPGADTIMCLTDTLLITATNGGSSQWYMNGMPLANDTTPSIVVSADGYYNMIKTNLNGCSDSSSTGIMVMFGDLPVADLGVDSTICDGDTICFALSNAFPVTYLWSNGSTTAAECFIGLTGANPITVTATDNAGCEAMDTVNVTVIGALSPSVTVDDSACPLVTATDADPNATSWVWDFGDGSPLGSGNPVSHTYAANGTYNATLVSSNQCFSANDAGTININCIIAIENTFGNALSVSPNPSNGTFMLKAQLHTAGPLHYAVTDISGRKIMENSNPDVRSYWSERIQVKAAPGIYFLSVESGVDRAVYRIVVE